MPLLGLGIVAGIAIGIGFLLLIVPGLILMTIWSVAAPVLVLERAGVFASLGRSRELVRGNGWQVFGVIVAIFAIEIVLGDRDQRDRRDRRLGGAALHRRS